ncbi:MAG: DciA family protein [Woeseiaceae bacterium]
MSMKSLENLLKTKQDNGLGDVIQHAQDMGDLVQVLQDSLPDEQKTAISAANIRENGELVVLAASSAWASRLRYETDTLIAAATAAGKAVSHCTVRVVRD